MVLVGRKTLFPLGWKFFIMCDLDAILKNKISVPSYVSN